MTARSKKPKKAKKQKLSAKKVKGFELAQQQATLRKVGMLRTGRLK